MLIAWTTVGTLADAQRLAREAIENRLAACVQIDGPIVSVYRWQDKTEQTEEFRLTLKFLPEQAQALAAWIQTHHPYATPEWVVVTATAIGEKYLSWARANSTNPPL